MPGMFLSWPRIAAGMAALIALAPGLGGCSEKPQTVIDAAPMSDANPVADAMVVADATPTLSWVTFTVTGCASDPDPPEQDAGPGDGGVTRPCTGTAPLELGFTAVAPAPIATYLWNLGDGATSDASHPVHVYDAPGTYDVSLLVAGTPGTAQAFMPGLIQVEPAGLGARCTTDTQCGAGRECVCGQGKACADGLEPGVCAQACSAADPCAEGVCADLGTAGPADPQDWQRALCLPGCASGAACPRGSSCYEVPGPDGGWVEGCFVAGVLAHMGESCVDATANPDHARCASGYCAALGARGACAALCTPGTCPASSACASFGGASPDQCLVRCESADACMADPWLACEPAGGAGELGFTVDENAWAQGYCAPRTCTDAAECGADGTCASGFCGP